MDTTVKSSFITLGAFDDDNCVKENQLSFPLVNNKHNKTSGWFFGISSITIGVNEGNDLRMSVNSESDTIIFPHYLHYYLRTLLNATEENNVFYTPCDFIDEAVIFRNGDNGFSLSADYFKKQDKNGKCFLNASPGDNIDQIILSNKIFEFSCITYDLDKEMVILSSTKNW